MIKFLASLFKQKPNPSPLYRLIKHTQVNGDVYWATESFEGHSWLYVGDSLSYNECDARKRFNRICQQGSPNTEVIEYCYSEVK